MDGVVESVLELVGRTPMVALHRVVDPGSARLLAKLESFNPSGSVKDRIALAIVEDAEAQGLISPGGSMVYATSGNSGAALAMVFAIGVTRQLVLWTRRVVESRRTRDHRSGDHAAERAELIVRAMERQLQHACRPNMRHGPEIVSFAVRRKKLPGGGRRRRDAA